MQLLAEALRELVADGHLSIQTGEDNQSRYGQMSKPPD
jgi:hypothetical protein